MSATRFDMLIMFVVTAAVFIAGVYAFMIAVPRNDDEHVHDGISAPGHTKNRLLRSLVSLRRCVDRLSANCSAQPRSRTGLAARLSTRRGVPARDTPRASQGDVAAMIDAEVNEGGPPSAVPCDTPFEGKPPAEANDGASDPGSCIEVCPAPDKVLHLPLGSFVGAANSKALMTSAGMELIRLVIPAGKEVPPHRSRGESTVHCLEGHVALEHDGRVIDLRAGDLLHLCPQETHAITGMVDSSVLVTRLRPHANELPEKIAGG